LIIQKEIAKTEQDLVLTSERFTNPLGKFPITRASSRGTPLVSLLPSTAFSGTETVVSHFLPEDPQTAQMIMLTQMGRIKRLLLTELVNLTGRGLTVIKFKG